MFKSSKGFAHLVVVIGVLTLVALGVFIYSKVFPLVKSQFLKDSSEYIMDGSEYVAKYLPQPKGPFLPNWKTYENEDLGFDFTYPVNLVVSETGGVVTLNHSIPYENSGGCDMSGGTKKYDRLDDFNVTFEIKPSKIVPEYKDGDYQAGSLTGVWQYEGVEGCGNTIYYFYLPGNRTLVVKKSLVQAFTGISTAWDVDEILETPGVIDKEESDKIFDRILETFRLFPENWKVFKSSIILFEVLAPSDWNMIEFETPAASNQKDVLIHSPDFRYEGSQVAEGFELRVGSIRDGMLEYESFDQFVKERNLDGKGTVVVINGSPWLRYPTYAYTLYDKKALEVFMSSSIAQEKEAQILFNQLLSTFKVVLKMELYE